MGNGGRTIDGIAAVLFAVAAGLTLAKVALLMTLLAATTSFLIGCIRIGQWAKSGKIGDV